VKRSCDWQCCTARVSVPAACIAGSVRKARCLLRARWHMTLAVEHAENARLARILDVQRLDVVDAALSLALRRAAALIKSLLQNKNASASEAHTSSTRGASTTSTLLSAARSAAARPSSSDIVAAAPPPPFDGADSLGSESMKSRLKSA
jgi:hypothetical protein